MRKNLIITILLVIFVTGMVVQGASQQTEGKYRILVVDETTSFEASMRVQGLVGGLKKREELEILTKTVNVKRPTKNPLKSGKVSGVDLVIIVPSTIETGRLNQVWVITKPFSTLPEKVRIQATERLNLLKDAIERAFGGQVEAVDVNDDVIPAYFSTIFLREGVLR
ncbi:MAG: hypothetical protein ABEJ25_03300 [Candidatus Bipolaricaulia bacterium]